jgi:hypothetical protein
MLPGRLLEEVPQVVIGRKTALKEFGSSLPPLSLLPIKRGQGVWAELWASVLCWGMSKQTAMASAIFWEWGLAPHAMLGCEEKGKSRNTGSVRIFNYSTATVALFFTFKYWLYL